MWQEKNGKLKRNFQFENFSEAWAFMSQVALLAEKLNHHPNWSNSYNQVEIELFSHDENRITQKDRNLAKAIDELI
tara:strand:- start:3748 stop:3975 length:228 start_codon:yes stop_codon:yes gene_type:complete